MTEWLNYIEHRGSEGCSVIGNLKILPGFDSPQLSNQRDILVYLPPSYESELARRYPVIYMHDGQNLFDQATAFSSEWGVDKIKAALAEEGIEAIVVGLPNTPQRTAEYSPFPHWRHGGGLGDRYLSFVAETVKPLIDRDFRTRPERAATGLLGSSMGGLISLYGFFRYHHVFGFAGAMSPSLWYGKNRLQRFIRHAPYLPGKLYLDMGTAEGQRMVLNTQQMVKLLIRKGYNLGSDLLYVEEEGAGHNEAAWSCRLCYPLRFLLGDLCRPAAGEPLELAEPAYAMA